MPYYKFGPNDILYNRIKTHPKVEFWVWSGSVYYDNTPHMSGTLRDARHYQGNVLHMPTGNVNLYELNVNRNTDLTVIGANTSNHSFDSGSSAQLRLSRHGTDTGSLIYPFITKDGTQHKLKTIASGAYITADYGDNFKGIYPFTSSIYFKHFQTRLREYGKSFYSQALDAGIPADSLGVKILKKTQRGKLETVGKEIHALKNTLNYYKKYSVHYAYKTSSVAVGDAGGTETNLYGWNKGRQKLQMISIPSIFYGSSIKKGTVNLKFFVTGTLVGEIKDRKQNGELIQVGPEGSYKSGSVAGVVLYNEGFILLTGSWDLTSGSHTAPGASSGSHKERYEGPSKSALSPAWYYFGQAVSGSHTVVSSSFYMSFQGTNTIPVLTMNTHARRGHLNYSNNLTFLTYNDPSGSFMHNGSGPGTSTSSVHYRQNDGIKIHSINSSSFNKYSSSHDNTTYISKIGIYDEDKNLIAVAKSATPVRKREQDDLTFRIKLDL